LFFFTLGGAHAPSAPPGYAYGRRTVASSLVQQHLSTHQQVGCCCCREFWLFFHFIFIFFCSTFFLFQF